MSFETAGNLLRNKNDMPRRPCDRGHKEKEITFEFVRSKILITESVPPVTIYLSLSSIERHCIPFFFVECMGNDPLRSKLEIF